MRAERAAASQRPPPGPTLGRTLTGRHGDPEPRSPPHGGSAGPRRARRPHHGGRAPGHRDPDQAKGEGRREQTRTPRLTQRSQRQQPPPAHLRAGRLVGRPHALASARRRRPGPAPALWPSSAQERSGAGRGRGLGEGSQSPGINWGSVLW